MTERRDPAGEAEARAAAVRRMEQLATLLDSQFRIPGTRWNIGLDGLIGLIPGVGDAATGLMSAGLVVWAMRLGVPKRVLVRMLGNVALDMAVGAVPVVGDIFDVGFKANRRNMNLMLSFMQGEARKRP